MLAVTDLTVVEGGARISDAKLAELLGYADKKHVTQLIKRNEDEFESYGGIYLQSEDKPLPGSKGGRPVLTYLLNYEQAILLTMFARTEKAARARYAIVTVFVAWDRGQLASRSSSADGITIPKDEYIALLRSDNAAMLEAIRAAIKKPRRAPIPLSTADKARIIALAAAGMTTSQIARETGRSKATISLLRNGFRLITGGNA